MPDRRLGKSCLDQISRLAARSGDAGGRERQRDGDRLRVSVNDPAKTTLDRYSFCFIHFAWQRTSELGKLSNYPFFT
jgi:hypothetical protein